MPNYQLLTIIPAIYTDAEVAGVAEKVAALVVAAEGTIVRSENLGKLKLAYPIKHQKHGYYWLVQFDAEPPSIAKLDNDLKLSEHVVRHMITERPAGAEKKVYKLEAYQSPVSEEGFTARKGAPRRGKTPAEAAPPPKQMMPKGPEMTMEELDKKLDQILEGSSEKV